MRRLFIAIILLTTLAGTSAHAWVISDLFLGNGFNPNSSSLVPVVPPPPRPNNLYIVGKDCRKIDYQNCVLDEGRSNFFCMQNCRRSMAANTICNCPSLADAEAQCEKNFGCPGGGVCSPDLGNPLNTDICCPPDLVACKRNCVNTQCAAAHVFNPANCACECPAIPCPAPFVINSVTCACGCPNTKCAGNKLVDKYTCQCICPPGQTDCGDGKCISLQTNPDNCGSCGNKCPQGKICQNGQCICGPPLTECSGVCLNLNTDKNNCGQCGHVCGNGEGCCNGTCKALQSDPSNCGSCGNACTGGKVCSNGACACPAGQTSCNGVCKNLQNDPANCGTCGKTCSGGKICQGGGCICPPGKTECMGICVDLKTDSTNCGACQIDCGNGICNNGGCICGAGRSNCQPNVGPPLLCCTDANGTCCDGKGCCPIGFPKCCANFGICCPDLSDSCCPPVPGVPNKPNGYCCGQPSHCCATGCCN